MSETPHAKHESITACLEADHRRLDALLLEVADLVEEGKVGEAGPLFAKFRAGLDLHITVEEEALFPAFESATGMAQGPTRVMRMEHVQIREAMDQVAQALAGVDAAAFRTARGQLESILDSHNSKEERMLYPMCDRALSPDEVSRVIGELRSPG